MKKFYETPEIETESWILSEEISNTPDAYLSLGKDQEIIPGEDDF